MTIFCLRSVVRSLVDGMAVFYHVIGQTDHRIYQAVVGVLPPEKVHRDIGRAGHDNLDEALLLRDTDPIKVVTYICRCGISSLLNLIRNRIGAESAAVKAFVSANLGSKTCPIKTEDGLAQTVHSACMSSVCEAVAVRDVVSREREKGKSVVTGPSCCATSPHSWLTA